MAEDVKKAVYASGLDAQYDEKAKRLLGNKYILANILVHAIDEFKGMKPQEVLPYIEGEPFISTIPVEPGLTNFEQEANGERIVGMNTENSEVLEGLIRFDIIFYVRMKDGISKIIINIEAQKEEPSKYDIINRAIFYVSRMISSQKERDFVKSNYNDIRSVYSIWICMNMEECCWNYIHLINDTILGKHNWKGNLDLINIVLLGLPKELPPYSEKYELHRMLNSLFNINVTQEEKLKILNKEYDIPVNENFRKEVSEMCNLSQGVKEEGIAKGREEGIAKGIAKGREETEIEMILGMYQNNISIEKIADIAHMSIPKVKSIIENHSSQ